MISPQPTRRNALCLLTLSSLAALAAYGKHEDQAMHAPAPAAAAQPTPGWDAFRDEYIEAFVKAHPVFAVRQGRHEFDGQLPDWSAEGIAAEIQRMQRHAIAR
jgi:hypothetical protein